LHQLSSQNLFAIKRSFNMKSMDILAAVLLVVGGLNWGLVGLFQFDLVAAIGGGMSGALARVIYVVVGLAAIYQAAGWRAIQRRWATAGATA
jgi:uncharacterized membrane protein YuzA (DUF378 family)